MVNGGWAARRLRRAATLSEGGIMLSEGGEEGILPQRAAGYSRGRHDEVRGRFEGDMMLMEGSILHSNEVLVF